YFLVQLGICRSQSAKWSPGTDIIGSAIEIRPYKRHLIGVSVGDAHPNKLSCGEGLPAKSEVFSYIKIQLNELRDGNVEECFLLPGSDSIFTETAGGQIQQVSGYFHFTVEIERIFKFFFSDFIINKIINEGRNEDILSLPVFVDERLQEGVVGIQIIAGK